METHSRRIQHRTHIYIQGSKNIVLRRWDKVNTNNSIKLNMSSSIEHFSLEKETVLHPVNYETTMLNQQNNKSLIEIA